MIERLRLAVDPPLALLRIAPVLWEARRDPELRAIQRAYLGWMPLCLFSEPLRWIACVLTAPWRFRDRYQRPHSFFVPHLAGNPSPSTDDVARSLELRVQAIRREFEGVERDQIETPSKALVGAGEWTTFPLMRAAVPIEANIAHCPETWAAAKCCPLPEGVRGGVYFSIMHPGTHVEPHCGPSNLKYRYHLTIRAADGVRIRSGDVWRSWEQDRCLILDDSLEHEVLHEGDVRRVVLIVDCWHPDLSAKERDFVTRVHRVWRQPQSAR